jgi:uncharacterized protein (DUF1501 family)
MTTTTNPKTTRRGLLTGMGLAALGAAFRARTALAGVSVAPAEAAATDRTLVTVFLRGGADGLSLLVPHAEDAYYRSRVTLALARPKDRRLGPSDRVIDLDGFFGLHPALAPLRPFYERGQLAVVTACGSGDRTRSHFEAMATVERGSADGSEGPASGWLARHLESTAARSDSPLRAVALGTMLPEALRGTSRATALTDVADLRLRVPFAGRGDAVANTLSRLYAREQHDAADPLARAGGEALAVLRKLGGAGAASYRAANGAAYPPDELGGGLRQVALLMKRGVGVEAAWLDQNGYDTHVAQGTSQGALAGLLRSLSGSLAAFATDLGPERWARTTVVVLSEFGRRLEENSGAGTDHGRAGVMFVLGGSGVAGGRIHGRWPGLAPHQLEGPGDVRVTTDYRCVLAEVLGGRFGSHDVASVFPGLAYRPVGVTARV